MLTLQINDKPMQVHPDTTLNALQTQINKFVSKEIPDKDMYYQIMWNGINLDRFPATHQYQVADKEVNIVEIYNDIINETHKDITVSEAGQSLQIPNSGNISFQRTIRVPDDGQKYPLPPGLGTYTIEKGDNGDIVLPMFQNEAMWMRFNKSGGGVTALKIGIGDINAITGQKWQPGVLSQDPQNYVLLPGQPWLDGIMVKGDDMTQSDKYSLNNLVRQFVALPIDSKATIEQQLLEQGKIDKITGGLQFEAFNLTSKEFKAYSTKEKRFVYNYLEKNNPDTLNKDDKLVFFSNSLSNNNTKNVDRKIIDVGIQDGDTFNVVQVEGVGILFVKSMTGITINVTFNPLDTVLDLKKSIMDIEGIPIDQQRIIFGGKQIDDDDKTLGSYNIEVQSTVYLALRLRGGGGDPHEDPALSIGAGGLISQKIYKDITYKLTDFYTKKCYSVKVSMINAYIHQKITGKPLIKTPVSVQTYLDRGYPWYKLYDEDREAVLTDKQSMFSDIKSIKSCKKIITHILDECCVCTRNMANVEFEPCGHQMCSECVVNMNKSNEAGDERISLIDQIIGSAKLRFQCHICRGEIESSQIKIVSGIVPFEDDNQVAIKIPHGQVIIIDM